METHETWAASGGGQDTTTMVITKKAYDLFLVSVLLPLAGQVEADKKNASLRFLFNIKFGII